MPTDATIPAGTSSQTFTISDGGTKTLLAGATRTQTSGTGVQATVTSSDLTAIDIEGTLKDTASGARALRINVTNGELIVGANGLIQSRDGDAVQAQSANGTLNVTNLGQIISTTSITTVTSTGATPPGAAYALNFNAAVGAQGAAADDYESGGVITNGSDTDTTALIRSDSGDAIRLGAHETLINYGTITGDGPVNDSSGNNTFNGTSTAQRYDISRGVRINAATSTNDAIENHGVISGSQHGVDVGNTAATNIQISNAAGATILGHNGSGVGADTTGAATSTVVVTNAGTILGEYAPTYDRAGLHTVDGDGDGVDVDGGATIINLAGGIIAGSGVSGDLAGQGAGGFDSNGRANHSEGISIGGGIVVNDGLISGADYGITVNNDSNPDGSRGGVAATTILNDATGTIIGQDGYAIRLENKTGTGIDDDTIYNFGTITGNGTVPDPNATVLREDGNPDPGTVGTLDGVTYTAANAGNARFVSGDGSAIQTGEGNDVLLNYGTITGNDGRAINLEGGDDTLVLYTGETVVGSINGGAGVDTLFLALDDRSSADVTGPNSRVNSGTLASVINFETLEVLSGTWTVESADSFASGATIAARAALQLGAGGSVSGPIEDDGTLIVAHSDAIAISGVSGSGTVQQTGSGITTLSGNSYSGGTQLYAGTVDVATADGAGTGAITFKAGAQTLRIEQAALSSSGAFANTISGFGDGDTIDLRSIAGAATATLDGSSDVLRVKDAAGNVLATLQLAGDYTGNTFSVSSDTHGGTNIAEQGLARLNALTLHVSEDAYLGDAQFVVLVDGQQVGGVQTVTASHAAGQYQDITVQGDFADPNSVAVKFTNDAYGDATHDRNLYVDSITLNGSTYQGEHADNSAGQNTATEAALLNSGGQLTFDTSHALALRVSEDAYQGDAQFVVLVDGQQVGGVQTATASHAAGQYQDITVHGDFTDPSQVTVEFINDAYGGNAARDRNLYVDSITLNGATYQGEHAANGAGENTASEAVLFNSGGALTFDTSHSLTLRVAEDAYNGNAQFVVTVDGQQVGGVQTVTAAHGAGIYQDITIRGDFSDPNQVAVKFINDLYGGDAAHDRNLYVDSLTVDGHVLQGEDATNTAGGAVPGAAALMNSGGQLVFDTSNSLTLRVAEDAYLGDAHFIVTVDGQQIGGVQTATTSHGAGQYQDITIHGDFTNPSQVAVKFIDDAYGGDAAHDRNLYVDSLTVSGHTYQGEDATNTAGPNLAGDAAGLYNGGGQLTFDLLHA